LTAAIIAIVYSQLKEFNITNLAYVENIEAVFLKAQEIFRSTSEKNILLQKQETASREIVSINELQSELQKLELAYLEGQNLLESDNSVSVIPLNKSKKLQEKLQVYYQKMQNFQQLSNDSLFIDETFIEMQSDVNKFLGEINAKVMKVSNINEVSILRQACVNKINKILEYDHKLINIKAHTETLAKLKLLSDWIKQTSKFLQEYANILQEFEQALSSNSQIILDNVNVQASQFNLIYQNTKNKFMQDFSNEQQEISIVQEELNKDISQIQEEIKDEINLLKKQFL